MIYPTFYASPSQVEAFVCEHYYKTGLRLRFPEALALMEQKGLLSSAALPSPAFSGAQTRADFEQAFSAMPFRADNILRSSHTYLTQGIVEEDALFPGGKDVYCIKHLPFMNTDLHTHGYFEITYIFSGSCRMFFDDNVVEMNEGELCIVPPDSPHAQPVEPGCFAIGLMVRRSTFDALFGELLVKDDLISRFFRDSLRGSLPANYLRLYTGKEDEQLRWYLQTLVGECYRSDLHANTCAVSLFKLFLAQAMRSYGSTATVHRHSIDGRKADAGMILQYIQNNYSHVTLRELAETFHYNETYLSRLLRRYTNHSFTEIVRPLRMRRAEEYLLHTDMKIQDITALLGYESADHFSRTFKAVHGISPSVFRKQRPVPAKNERIPAG